MTKTFIHGKNVASKMNALRFSPWGFFHFAVSQRRKDHNMANPNPSPEKAAQVLLEHIIYHALADRVGDAAADAFLAELVLIADGKVRHGALVANH